MPKKYGITFKFIADMLGKNHATVRKYFYRNGLSIRNPDDVKKYITKFPDEKKLLCGKINLEN